jgi:hypothetical protein
VNSERSDRAARRRHRGAWVAVVAYLYVVYGMRPLVAEPFQLYDDYTYLSQAEAIARWFRGGSSRWLGDFTTLTLAKAPLFALWLALLHLFAIPLRIAEFALLAATPFLFARALRPLVRIGTAPLALIALLFVGTPLLPYDLRMLRSALHAALVFAFLSAAVGLALRMDRPLRDRSRWALLLGASFGLNYLNREEAIWMLPTALGALATTLPAWWRAGRARGELRPAALATGATAMLVGGVSLLDFACYGLAATTQRRAPGFTAAYQTLTRLEPRSRERYVPITAATRRRAYELSPTFARLRASLEGPASDGFASHPDHLALHGRDRGEREFFVTTFDYALREALFQGGARTAGAMEETSRKIAAELEAAIAAGRIEAGPRGPALLTPPLPGDLARIAARTFTALGRLFAASDVWFPTGPAYSSGEPRDVQRIQAIASSAVAPTRDAAASCAEPAFSSFRRVALAVGLRAQQLLLAIGCAAALRLPLFGARPRSERVAVACASALLALATLAHCASIAALDVLGWPVLSAGGAYNNFGFLPLSALAAFGLGRIAAQRAPSE